MTDEELAVEAKEWRRRHTWGGYLWPQSEEEMSVDEMLDEFEWLIGNGVHPLLAAQELHRNPDSLERAAYRRGRPELARAIQGSKRVAA